MLAYAVAAQALQHPLRPFYWGIFSDILYYPYWQLHGDLQLTNTVQGMCVCLHIKYIFIIAQMDGCDNKTTIISDVTGKYCPKKSPVVTIMLAVYILFGNILLINLLIAIFT
jgi:hypothetical protein